MSASLDLIDYFRLDVSFDSTDTNITIETVATSDRAKGLRQVRTVKRWKRIKAIGRGSFGSVWLEHVDDNSETRRAVKEIPKRNGTSMSVINIDYNRELVALGRLSKYQDVFVDFYGWYENDQSVFLAMEYFNYGDLGQYITQDLKERDTQEIAKQLLEGLVILHQQNWAHRDLKPQNIFVVSPSPSWWVKIGDFGISKRLREDESGTNIGTLNYTAPEIMGYIDDGVDSEEKEHGRTNYTVKVDMWSLGCLLYQMLALTLPFPISKKLVNYCLSNKRNFPLGPLQQRLVSDEGCQFIQKLMTIEPSERITASAALETKWVSEAEHHDTAVGVKRALSKRIEPNIERLVRQGSSHNLAAKPPSPQLIMESKIEFNMNSTALYKPSGSSPALKTDPISKIIYTLIDENLGLSEFNAWIGASPVATPTIQPLPKQTNTSKSQQPNVSTSSPQPQKKLLSPYDEEVRPGWAVALWDFEKINEHDFGFKKGEVLLILNYCGYSDWWTAMNNNKVKGNVPRYYFCQHRLVAITIFSQKPKRNGDIELVQGKFIMDITISSEDWWTGTNHLGGRGGFPQDCVLLYSYNCHGRTEMF